MSKYNADGMIDCPPNMSERWFKKLMARQETEEVLRQSFTMQSIPPSEFYRINSICNMADDKGKDLRRYIDMMLKAVVIDPPQIKVMGIKYFDERDDISTPEELIQTIDRFLRPGTIPGNGTAPSAT